MNNSSCLLISELFYSIQGEGASAGTPAVFLRLAGCNMNCQGFSSGCDSKDLWQKSVPISFEKIIEHFKQEGWIEKLACSAHLVITGGEPLLQQAALIKFIAMLDQECSISPFLEIETNSTIVMDDALLARINQINASPKLANSGELVIKRFNRAALTKLAASPKTKFKFVIQHPNDIDEIYNQYLLRFDIKKQDVWLMPEGGTTSELTKHQLMVLELCKKHSLNFSPRLQIYLAIK